MITSPGSPSARRSNQSSPGNTGGAFLQPIIPPVASLILSLPEEYRNSYWEHPSTQAAHLAMDRHGQLLMLLCTSLAVFTIHLRGCFDVAGTYYLIPAFFYAFHVMFMWLHPTHYTRKTRSIFLFIHVVMTITPTFLRFTTTDLMRVVFNALDLGDPLKTFITIASTEAMAHMLQCVAALLPFKFYLLYLCLRLPVDVMLVIPTQAKLLAADANVLRISKSACRWGRAALFCFAPLPTLAAGDEVCHVAAPVYVCSVIALTVGYGVPFLITYWTELKSKLTFISRNMNTTRRLLVMPDVDLMGTQLVLQVMTGAVIINAFATAMAINTAR